MYSSLWLHVSRVTSLSECSMVMFFKRTTFRNTFLDFSNLTDNTISSLKVIVNFSSHYLILLHSTMVGSNYTVLVGPGKIIIIKMTSEMYVEMMIFCWFCWFYLALVLQKYFLHQFCILTTLKYFATCIYNTGLPAQKL